MDSGPQYFRVSDSAASQRLLPGSQKAIVFNLLFFFNVLAEFIAFFKVAGLQARNISHVV